jgi:hypothetical protein
VYCLQDGFSVKGGQNLTGQDVVIKVEQGEVHLGGNATLTLDAPDTGDHKGLLLYLPMENDSPVTLNAGPGSVFAGTILAPASGILLKSDSAPLSFQSQIIGYTIEIEGSNKIIITYTNEQNYDAVTMPEVQLSE